MFFLYIYIHIAVLGYLYHDRRNESSPSTADFDIAGLLRLQSRGGMAFMARYN